MIGCGDNSCLIKKPKGMATNGGCRCFNSLDADNRIAVNRKLRQLQWFRAAYIKLANSDRYVEDGNALGLICDYKLMDEFEAAYKE